MGDNHVRTVWYTIIIIPFDGRDFCLRFQDPIVDKPEKKQAGLENKAIAYQTQLSDTRDANAFGTTDSIAARGE